MKSKNLMMILILFSFINKIKNLGPPELGEDYPGIKCGKDNPEKEKDCTKYGTDSGMLCCYVLYNNKTRECQLMNENTAVSFGIKPKNNFTDEESWSCGNKSYYYNINIILFLILIFLY